MGTIHPLSPGYAKTTYDGTLFPHHMTTPVKFDGTPVPGVEPSVVLKDGSVALVSDAVTDLWNVLLPFYETTVHIGLVEVHTVDADTGLDQFIYGFDLGLLGTSGSARVAACEVVMTYKLTNGGLFRLYMMEPSAAANVRALPPMTETRVANLNTFITGDTSPVWGRKNAYPFSVVSYVSKYNDKLRKQQGLS